MSFYFAAARGSNAFCFCPFHTSPRRLNHSCAPNALNHRDVVLLVRFETVSGTLQYTGTPQLDTFQSKDQALNYLEQQGDLEVEGRGEAVLGYIVIGNTGLLLLVERARISARLPGDVEIKTVATARWHRLPLQADLVRTARSEVAANFDAIEGHISKLIDFPLHGAHWYCDCADVTRPFPSSHSAADPSWQFTWNAWLMQSFRSVQLEDCCPALMQGTAESRELVDGLGDFFNLVLLSRRSRLNPGTRYIARGLNDLDEPGNEIECEQIVWKPEKEPSGKALWTRYSWRRGTVPIRWGVFLKNSGLGEAEIVIRKNKTFAGSKRYIRRLQKRFHPSGEIERQLEKVPVDSADFPVVFISLLRKGLPDRNRSESTLAEAFDRALSCVRKIHDLSVAYYTLDWHEMDKQLGTQRLIEALWLTMKGTLENHGIASGHYTQQISSGPTTDWCGRGTVEWYAQQQGLTRYNCADSLDRTNIASFFVCVQVRQGPEGLSDLRVLKVFVEQCRQLKLAILSGDEAEPLPVPPRVKPTLKDRLLGSLFSGQAIQSPTSFARPTWPSSTGRSHRRPDVQFRQTLPVGWEARIDPESGCTLYIDHVNKKTSWTPPPENATAAEATARKLAEQKSFRVVCKEEILSKDPWAMLNSSVEEIRRKVLPEALSSIADVFLQNGDRNAFFYTGSQAMHSDKIMIFEPESSQLKKNTIGGPSNSFIAIARRYNNLLKDNDRQAQIELFLGINLEKHLLSSASEGSSLESLNVIYKPGPLTQDMSDTDDENDPVDQINYPALSTRTVIHPKAELETRRSVSSPNLAGLDGKEGLSPGRESRCGDGGDTIQMYSFEDAIPPSSPHDSKRPEPHHPLQ